MNENDESIRLRFWRSLLLHGRLQFVVVDADEYGNSIKRAINLHVDKMVVNKEITVFRGL